jgi:hypothetical protein
VKTFKGKFWKGDHWLSQAVGNITETRAVFLRWHNGETLKFVGQEVDVSVASELFQYLTKAFRHHTRDVYGTGWSPRHEDYRNGICVRVLDRSKIKPSTVDLTTNQRTGFELVLVKKSTAIEKFMEQHYLMRPHDPKKKSRFREQAVTEDFRKGYAKGDDYDLGIKNRLKGDS